MTKTDQIKAYLKTKIKSLKKITEFMDPREGQHFDAQREVYKDILDFVERL